MTAPKGKQAYPRLIQGCAGSRDTYMVSDHQTLAFKSWFCTLSNLSEPQFFHL